MKREINEADWKIFRTLQSEILDRYCKVVITEINAIGKKRDKSNHQKYLEIFDLLRKRDKEIALLFDDTRRSNSIERIVGLRKRKLLTDEEFAKFGEETRSRVNSLLEIFR